MAIGTYISIITLNVNGLNGPTKRHRLAEQIQKQDPYICYLQETHFRPKDTYKLKVRGWKNVFHANGKQKKTGVNEVAQSCPTLQPHGHQAPSSMGFSRQEYWSGLPFPSPRNRPNAGIKPRSPTL